MTAPPPTRASVGRRWRLLIVEDEVELATTLAEGLRGDGFAVDVRHDGATAITYLAQHDLDLVVLDRDLPGLHGDAVCRALAAIDHPARVLMLSAAGSSADRVTGFEVGADDYLTKPFEYAELVARLRALGRLRHAAPRPDRPRLR
ncbi:response regulator transcription factor [Microlunatus speluncae]|uniref:response regulator transcription factor n=1 Tax=Microlunatus speluncae TaxID=2594267 RepID=UPI0012663E12|nr:response regulator [Microlunatus speluncae]